MNIIAELLLCLFVILYSAIIIRYIVRHRVEEIAMIKKFIHYFWNFSKRNFLSLKILRIGFVVLPGYFFFMNLNQGLLHAMRMSFKAAILLIILWAGFNLFLIGLKRMVTVEDQRLSYLFLYTFMSMILIVWILFTQPMQWLPRQQIFIAIVLSSTYVINFFIMLSIMKLAHKGSIYSTAIWKIVILIIIIFIFTLSLAFYFVNQIIGGGFNKELLTWFDILYYTVISFTTIGYGDIYPTHWLMQLLAMITSCTSVLCLVVLLNAVMSAIKQEDGKNI